MTIICPCCKATNATAVCRRCKADLGLLVQLETRRAACVAAARNRGDIGALREAESLRPGDDLRRERALAHLLAADYAAVLAQWRNR